MRLIPRCSGHSDASVFRPKLAPGLGVLIYNELFVRRQRLHGCMQGKAFLEQAMRRGVPGGMGLEHAYRASHPRILRANFPGAPIQGYSGHFTALLSAVV
jgi:hypothetical protein